MAAIIRLVISVFSMRNFECTLATTTSRRSEKFFLLVERAVLEDVDLNPRKQPERGQYLVDLGHHVELAPEVIGAQAVGDGKAGAVVG